MWNARGSVEEVQRMLPGFHRLLSVTCSVGLAVLMAQVALQLEEAMHKGSSLGALHVGRGFNGTATTGKCKSRDADVVESPVDEARWMRPKGDIHVTSLLTAFLGFALAGRGVEVEMHMRRRLLTFAGLSFFNLAANLAVLLNKMEMPPYAAGLLATQCPMPLSEIRGFVDKQLLRFRSRLEASLPNNAHLPPCQEGTKQAVEPETFINLCSVASALGNAYLIFSSVMLLWTHLYSVQMMRAMHEATDGQSLDSASAGRVIVLARSAARQVPRRSSFVPFSGRPRKLW